MSMPSENRPETLPSEVERILRSLSDRTCRTIMREAKRDPSTASELVERCRRSRSTVYRKLETLVQSGLLAETTRIRTDGKDATEFQTAVDGIRIEFADDGDLRLEFEPSSSADDGPVSGPKSGSNPTREPGSDSRSRSE